MSNFSKIHRALSKAFYHSETIDVDDDFRLIIFSDHHRGRRDGADDFVPCEKTYTTALQYYLDNHYELCLLGDVEEFWENPFWIVMKKYKEILLLEKQFHLRTKLYRIWGNHDDYWENLAWTFNGKTANIYNKNEHSDFRYFAVRCVGK